MKQKTHLTHRTNKKCWRTLPLRSIMILLLCFSSHHLLATDNYLIQNGMSLEFQDRSIRDAFSEIERTSDYVFLITSEAQTSLNKTVSVSLKKESISQVMNKILEHTDLGYYVVEKQVSVYRKQGIQPKNEPVITKVIQPTGITVRGLVTDKRKEPLIGVTVVIEGTTKGMATNADGSFMFDNVSPNATLIFSYIGMKPQAVKISGRKVINVVMEDDNATLQEVVVTGYQEVKKERMTGSIATIKAGDIKNLNVKTMDQVFSGAIAGVSAVTTGRPGQNARIQIRGVNSLTGNTEPIWIVDGMPLQGETPKLSSTGGGLDASMFQSGIGNISPDDIESITVLKDAAASAIYGARAANGVIVVKTKSGQAGKTRYNITAHFGISERPKNNIRMMNSAEKIQFEKEIYNDTQEYGVGRVGEILRQASLGIISQAEADQQIATLSAINTDWFKELYRPGLTTQINANMSGGSEKTQYYNSFNFLNEKGTELNSNYNRFRFSSKLDHQFSSKVRMQTEIAATYRSDRGTASKIGTLQYAMYANPYETPDGYDRSWDMTLSRIRDGYKWETLNMKDELMRNTASSRYMEASLRAKLDWDILKGLNFSSQGIVSIDANHSRKIQGEKTYTNFQDNWLKNLVPELLPEQVRGSLFEGTTYAGSYTFRNVLEYNLNLNDDHYIDLFGGQEISNRITYGSSTYSPVFDELHRIVGFPELPVGTDLKKIQFSMLGGTGRYQSKLSSFFLNGSYSYQDRYVASGSIRYDGSDIIGNKNQFTPLWNVSGKWNIHKEPFFKTNFINTLSLRSGYGYTGSIDKNAYPFVMMILGKSNLYDNVPIPSSFVYANPNVKWQTKKDFNVGLESSFWDARIQLGVNYYNNMVFDLLDEKELPMSSGRNTVKENIANVVNKGWELEAGIDILRLHNLNWNVRGNVAFNKNIITRTLKKSLSDLPVIDIKKGGQRNFVEGYPVSGWFGYRFAEVNPANGHTMVYDNNGEKFDMDLLNNQTLGLKAPDPVFLGDYYAPIIGGFSSNLTWDRWVFSMNFEFKAGNYIKSFNTFSGLSSENRHFSDKNRWRAPGDVARIPEIAYGAPAYSKYMYDVMLEKGDYLRCTYSSLGYNVPGNILKTMHLESARITFTANNLFTLTAYKGIDPSLMGDFGYPNSRRYSLSFNVSF